MFKLNDKLDYTWPVAVQIPQDNGRFTRASFKARFLMLPQSRINELVGSERDDEDENLMREVLLGWEGINDLDGTPIDFNDETRDKILDNPIVRIALIRAFFASLAGKSTKN